MVVVVYGKCWSGRVTGEEQLTFSSVLTSIGRSRMETADLGGGGLNSDLIAVAGEGEERSSVMSISRRISSISEALLASSSL